MTCLIRGRILNSVCLCRSEINSRFLLTNVPKCRYQSGRRRPSPRSRSRVVPPSPIMASLSPSASGIRISPQHFDYFLVLDFEATCERQTRLNPQEIIEFPCLKVSGKTFEVEETFHQYVEPEVHKELTPFCTELTGIIQEMVDGKQHIKAVLKDFNQWMLDQKLLEPGVKCIFVTCGDWDLKSMLSSQARHFGFEYPDYLKTWINIKKPFCDVTTTYPKGMLGMLHSLKLPHVGRHHSGIDDCRNIANILKDLAQRGFVFKGTGHI